MNERRRRPANNSVHSQQSSQYIVVIALVFCAFLIWLWLYSPGSTDDTHTPSRTSAEVREWLDSNGLQALERDPKIVELSSLRDLLSLDLKELEQTLSGDLHKKLIRAINELDLQLWLGDQNLKEDILPVLLKEGLHSRLQLCALQLENTLQVSNKIPRPADKQRFLHSLQDLHDHWEGCKERESQEETWSVWGVLWRVIKITFYILLIVTLLLGALYIFAITVLTAVMEAIAEAIAEGIAFIIATIFTVIIGGFITAILSALTGRRVAMPQVPSVRMRNRNASRKSNTTTVPRFNLGLVDRIRGTYLDYCKSTISWNHEDGEKVGGSSVATIKLTCNNESPYQLQTSDSLWCRVVHKGSTTTVTPVTTVIPHVIEPTPPTSNSLIKLSFTTRLSGSYEVDIRVNNKIIGGKLISRNYIPGPVDASKTVFVNQTAVIVVTKGVYSGMGMIPKDCFGNVAIINEDLLSIDIHKNSLEGEVINPEFVVFNDTGHRFELLMKVEEEGHYVGCVKYGGQRIGPSKLTIICLSDKDMQIVEKNVRKKSLNTWYEAQLLSENGKSKRVYCYISPRQLQVREYFMKIIPTRAFTCKVCPATRINFCSEPEKFILDDGFQSPATLTSPSREILGATFYKYVLKNIGGSEKFQDKQEFFFRELTKHHGRRSRSEIRLTINRFDILESARAATKKFSSSDWCKKFVVEFTGEDGLDWGGVSREFFERLCVQLFDSSNLLFRTFNEENHQALVHPNHKRPARLKVKYFEFAGKVVGKCLYESAMGNTLLVKARFTRSFLAQLIGLRIHYKYFESDDPDLYTTKVQYIQENDVTDLGLIFAEEEFETNGGAPTVVPLIENGADIEVTEDNKMKYLNLLAQHRLVRSVKEEIEAFLKGLNDIVPDNLLSMFDENELELLMCGMDKVSFDDLKQNCVINQGSIRNVRFQEVLSWFWTVVSSFTQEEIARLLQFVTGCSQLPPGGFKELEPRFTITPAPTRGRLPTAHTCFNQLCLPDYDSCEQFQSSLMLAINEGAEGFGML